MKTYTKDEKIGAHRIISEPMKGGMGVVYPCHDLENDRAVALKTFKSEYLSNVAARERFLREGTAWVELGKHPNIVQCYDVKSYESIPYLVLEYVPKNENRRDASLRNWQHAPLHLAQALIFTIQIARGLAHASEKIPGFVHRDLKPENILVGADKLPGTRYNRLRVTDFGLVAVFSLGDQILNIDNQETSDVASSTLLYRTHVTHGGAGTPPYMAPEQWRGDPVGAYTDVYALGCILYEMLTGELAAGKNEAEWRRNHCEGKLGAIPSNLPNEVVVFLKSCLAKDVQKRYQSWAEVLPVLESICGQLGLSLPASGQEYANITSQEDVVSSYNILGISYADIGDAQTSIKYFEKALIMFRKINDKLGESTALGNLGVSHSKLGNTQIAIEFHQKRLEILKVIGDKHEEGITLGNLGNCYYLLGDVHQAASYYEQQLVIARNTKDRGMEGAAMGNLGVAHLFFGDPKRALKYHEEHLRITQETGDELREGNALGNLGEVYMNLGDFHKALEHHNKAKEIKHRYADRHGESRALGNLGRAYQMMGDTKAAISYFEQCFELTYQINDKQGQAIALGNLGSTFASIGNIKRALQYFEKAKIIQSELGDLNGLALTSLNMAKLYLMEGNDTQAEFLAKEAETLLKRLGSPHLQQTREFLSALEEAPKFTKVVQQTAGALASFMNTETVGDMQEAIDNFPILRDPKFQEVIKDYIKEHGSPENQYGLEQRLESLKQLSKFY